jgi:hypothetical protein
MNIRNQLERITSTWDEEPYPTVEISPHDPNIALFVRAAEGPRPLKYNDKVFWIWDYRYDPRVHRFIFVLDLDRLDEITIDSLR